MKALGGDVQVESTPGKGTRVVAYCNRLGIDSDIEGDEGEVSSREWAQYRSTKEYETRILRRTKQVGGMMQGTYKAARPINRRCAR